MKIPWWAIVVGALALLGGAYVLGRWDAPDGDDAVTASLLAGVNAYAREHNRMANQINAYADSIAAGSKRERALAAKRTPTPILVPASCKVWADNLVTCDSQVVVLKGAVAHTGHLLAIARRGDAMDSTRMDSLTIALTREVGKGKILGITLPSRKTSFLAGSVVGSIVMGGACVLAR